MVIALVSKPGLTSASALSIPKDWDAAWFRGFINNLLKGGDVRNAVGSNGISVTGSIASPYATIGIGGIGATYPIILSPPAGTYALQIDGATFAAISMNASGATGFTSDFYIFQNTGAAGSGGSFIGTRNANAINFQTNSTTRLSLDGVGNLTNSVSGTVIFSTTSSGMFCNSWGSQSGVQTIVASSGLSINGGTTITSGGLSVTGGTTLSAASGVALSVGLVAGQPSIACSTIQCNGAAVTASSGAVNYGGTISATATAGGGAAVPATVAGFIIINVAGTARKIPFFAT